MDHLSSRLADQQRELFARLLAQEGLQGAEPPLIPRRSRSGSLPLSYAQQRLWFLQRFGADGGAYNIPRLLRLTGVLRVDAIRFALSAIVNRHEALRTCVVEQDGKPVQVIGPPIGLDVPLVDLRDLPLAEREPAAVRLARAHASAPFDLSQPPMVRATLVQLRADEHLLLVTMHHIASDGWSLGVFAREVSALYQAYGDRPGSPLPELPIQYADYAAWQREWLAGDIEARQIGYWRRQLAALPDLALPMARMRPSMRNQEGAHVDFEIAGPLRDSLSRIASAHETTFFMTALALFQLLLHRYSGQADIAVGTPIAGRTRLETEGLIGFFVNTLVMRTDLSGQPTFEQLIERVRETALSAYANQDVPFDRLVQELQPERQGNKAPLFQVLFTMQDAREASQWDLPGLQTEWTEGTSGHQRFDLALELKVTPSGLRGRFGFRTDIFDTDTIERMASHLVALLESVCASPRAPIGDLAILPSQERWQLLEGWNQTAAAYPDGTLHGLVEEQVQRSPDQTAVLDGGRALTYAALDRRANRLAHFLGAQGVGPGACVGVCMTRTADLIVALLGILKAGAAYVPLDPSYPADRLAFMLDDSGARVVLTEAALDGRLPRTGRRIVPVDTARETIDACPATAPSVPRERGAAAYIIYTSGSTGRPKGVVIRHASVVTLMHWARGLHDADELSGMLASTSVCFDLSVFEIFLPLCWGGTAIVAHTVLDLQTSEHRALVRLINTVPSAIGELVRMKAVPDGVLTINLAGEALTRALVDRVYRDTKARRVLNLYGPTEDTTYSTYVVLERDDRGEVTIGRPIANTRAYVLNARLQPSPIGIPGDLYLAGAGLALEYLSRPDLTADCFVPDPFGAAGERMYRTGDRAAWLASGELRFLGRGDQQVKIRGYRIELGEIETVLRAHEGVSDAAVLAYDADGGERRLVGYVTARHGQPPPDDEALRDALRRRLPEYMVPSVIVMLEVMPLTPNGKLDRQRLPTPDAPRLDARSYVGPATATHEVLAGIWADVLGRGRVGIRDNFFRAGGHSLLAMQVISKVRDTLQIDAPVRELFEAPTIEEFARALARHEARPGQTERIATIFKEVSAMTASEAATRP
jgi:amino acid adenylation domain-containing protein